MKFEGPNLPEPKKPSTFVDVVAWIFIIMAGSSTFISILQNVMINFLIPGDKMTQAMEQANLTGHLPALAIFIFSHFNYFFLLFFFVSVLTLVSAIGLLKRKNWARVTFIVLLSMGIIWNIGGVVFQFTMFNDMLSSVPAPETGQMVPEFARMVMFMKIGSLIMALGFSALFGWIIKKLVSAPIKAEFS